MFKSICFGVPCDKYNDIYVAAKIFSPSSLTPFEGKIWCAIKPLNFLVAFVEQNFGGWRVAGKMCKMKRFQWHNKSHSFANSSLSMQNLVALEQNHPICGPLQIIMAMVRNINSMFTRTYCCGTWKYDIVKWPQLELL